MRPGGRLGLQNRMRPVFRRVGWVRFPCTPAIRLSARLSHSRRIVMLPGSRLLIATLAVGALAVAVTAGAQVDTAAPRPSRHNPADTVRPPISPKRAFLLSLAAPGAGQSILGRHRAGAALIAVEAMSIAMS